MDYDEAKEKLHERKFLVKREYVENDGTHNGNEVQGIVDLVAGTSYPKGTTVTLLVWEELPTEENSTETDPFAPQEPTTAEEQPSQGVEEPTATSPLIPQTTVPPTEAPTNPVIPGFPIF